MGEVFDLFVPGRLCLLGEHTDWMAPHFSLSNAQIPNGFCILVCTNEGIYTRTKKVRTEEISDEISGNVQSVHADDQHIGVLTFTTSINGSTCSTSVVLDQEQLQVLAKEKGSYLSYVYGTAASVLTHPRVKQLVEKGVGINIDNYLTTLMMKKGLSSSAAICVTVVRCFNLVYELDLSINDIIDYAFNGERLTHSLCGKMDFVVAIGKGLAVFEFNASTLEIHILDSCPSPLHFVIADLNSSKDTISILASLQKCFPTPTSLEEYRLHEYQQRNTKVALDCIQAIEEGNVEQIGKLMNIAQNNFDRAVFDINPVDLISPRLHECLSNMELQRISVGRKGVGSQGDGSIQVLCKSKEDQQAVVTLLQGKLGCGYTFTLTIDGIVSPNDALFHKFRPRRAVIFVGEDDVPKVTNAIHGVLRLGFDRVYLYSTRTDIGDSFQSSLATESQCFNLQVALQNLVLNVVTVVLSLSAIVADITDTGEQLLFIDTHACNESIDEFVRKSKGLNTPTISADKAVLKSTVVDFSQYLQLASINSLNDLIEVVEARVSAV